MYLKQRDREILQFIQDYKSITVNICSKIHFRKSKYNYIEASRRLKIMHKNGVIKRTRSKHTSEFIYYNDKPLSPHDIHILEVYAELIFNGLEILNFEQQRPFLEETYFVDGFIEFAAPAKNGKRQHHSILYEIDLSHASGFDRTIEIYESRDMQTYFMKEYKTTKEKFPVFLIVSHVIPKNPEYHNEFKIEYMDFSLEGLIHKVM